jgi:hypothetical protein
VQPPSSASLRLPSRNQVLLMFGVTPSQHPATPPKAPYTSPSHCKNSMHTSHNKHKRPQRNSKGRPRCDVWRQPLGGARHHQHQAPKPAPCTARRASTQHATNRTSTCVPRTKQQVMTPTLGCPGSAPHSRSPPLTSKAHVPTSQQQAMTPTFVMSGVSPSEAPATSHIDRYTSP